MDVKGKSHVGSTFPSNVQHRISARHVQSFLAGAVNQGYDPLKIIENAGLPASLYNKPSGQIDGEQLQRLIGMTTRSMNDFFLGFLKIPLPVSTQANMTRIRQESRFNSGKSAFDGVTFEEVLRQAILSSEAFRDDISCHYFIDLKRQECVWSIRYDLKPTLDARLFYWFRLMANYKQFCAVIGRRLKLKRVCFEFPPPGKNTDINYDVFACDVLFDQPVNALVFHRDYLLLPVREGLGAQFEYQNWFVLPGDPHSRVKQVEKALVQLQENDIWYPTITTVADRLGVQPRALRRQLARENESFLNVRNRVRCEQAIRLLVTTNIPVAEIASQIGFAEAGDFTRAFKSWTQLTPTSYRIHHTRQY